jgi:cell division protein FtsI (penicillin-binding protein 3)
VKTFSIYATPHLMFDFREAAQKLSALFPQVSQSALQKRLRSSKRFAWVARHITPEQKEEVLSLGIPGIEFMEDQRRFWPHGSLFSHLLGLTNVDQTGISGLEKGLDRRFSSPSRKCPDCEGKNR